MDIMEAEALNETWFSTQSEGGGPASEVVAEAGLGCNQLQSCKHRLARMGTYSKLDNVRTVVKEPVSSNGCDRFAQAQAKDDRPTLENVV